MARITPQTAILHRDLNFKCFNSEGLFYINEVTWWENRGGYRLLRINRLLLRGLQAGSSLSPLPSHGSVRLRGASQNVRSGTSRVAVQEGFRGTANEL